MTASLNGTVEVDRTPWTGLFPIDAVTPIAAVHLGIEYPGEVIRAARWSAGLGQAPEDRSHFKIVLLQNPPRLGPSKIAGRIIGEITAAKQAAYLTRRDVDAAAIHSALRDRKTIWRTS